MILDSRLPRNRLDSTRPTARVLNYLPKALLLALVMFAASFSIVRANDDESGDGDDSVSEAAMPDDDIGQDDGDDEAMYGDDQAGADQSAYGDEEETPGDDEEMCDDDEEMSGEPTDEGIRLATPDDIGEIEDESGDGDDDQPEGMQQDDGDDEGMPGDDEAGDGSGQDNGDDEPTPGQPTDRASDRLRDKLQDLGQRLIAGVDDPERRNFYRDFLNRHSGNPVDLRNAVRAQFSTQMKPPASDKQPPTTPNSSVPLRTRREMCAIGRCVLIALRRISSLAAAGSLRRSRVPTAPWRASKKAA